MKLIIYQINLREKNYNFSVPILKLKNHSDINQIFNKNEKVMKRRKFITNSVTAAAGTIILPTIIPSSVIGKNPPSDKINIGWIGCGRQGSGDVSATMRFDIAMVVAVADVDSKRATLGKQRIEGFYTRQATAIMSA